jgi:hypothetical protein
VGAILAKLKKNHDALSSMKRVLEMVESEELESTGEKKEKREEEKREKKREHLSVPTL